MSIFSIASSLPGQVGDLREVEVQTSASRRMQQRQSGRFLKGPIPMAQISAAAKLPGRALVLFLAVHHRTALSGKPMVTLPKRLLTELGVHRDAKARGLHELERAGLVRVERSKGRTALVGLVQLGRKN